ncbi:toll/interleukin-1 receptor domain-containing protein [Oenococcus oeni]|uniref:toll/interleukin-1 receptor domain-containing protein n=1 Tax=Oenococcus oeni TaxID=1247 RepID=UPI0009B52305|nr:toll/interleukin-1 receptor domain-containing protein [Oenococcus oeni]
MSYSHTQQELATALAKDLQNNGISTIFDGWDLPAGYDLDHFMEQNLKDSSIDYIIVLCDQDYKNKADKKDGSGVSTESTIMTPEAYGSITSSRIIPLAIDFNSENKAVVPTFLATKKYINFNSKRRPYNESLEELERRIYGETVLKRPPLGLEPNFTAAEPQDDGIRKIQNISFQIENALMGNPLMAQDQFKTAYLPALQAFLTDWDKQCAAKKTIAEQVNAAAPVLKSLQKTFHLVYNDTAFDNLDDVLLFLNLMIQQTSYTGNVKEHRLSFDFVRYVIFMIIGGDLIINTKYKLANALMKHVFTNLSNHRGNFESFYPMDLIQDKGHSFPLKNGKINTDAGPDFILDFFDKNLDQRTKQGIKQFDLLLYYVSQIEKGRKDLIRHWWYPITWVLWTNEDRDFPLLNNLFSAGKDALSIFDSDNFEETEKKLKTVKTIPTQWDYTEDFPMPSRFL